MLRKTEERVFDDYFGLALSPDGKLLAGGSNDTSMWVLWAADTGKVIHSYEDIRAGFPMAFAPNSKLVASNGGGVKDQPFTEIWIWEAVTGKVVRRFPCVATASAFSPDGKTLAAAIETEKAILLWDVSDLDSSRKIK